jgi:hypothetical protein
MARRSADNFQQSICAAAMLLVCEDLNCLISSPRIFAAQIVARRNMSAGCACVRQKKSAAI